MRPENRPSLQKAVGLARLRPSGDAAEVFSDHAGNVLHGFNLGTHHVGTPLLEHLGNGVDLFAIKDLAQLFSTEQGTDRTFGRDVGDQRIEIGSLRRIQPVAVLEQRPTQALRVGIDLLFESLVSSLVAASKSTPLTNHGSITPNAASNRLLCVTCLRLVYAEGRDNTTHRKLN
ncbi:hypothetical protein QFZ96_002398 [Paraburkholderia youngii]